MSLVILININYITARADAIQHAAGLVTQCALAYSTAIVNALKLINQRTHIHLIVRM